MKPSQFAVLMWIGLIGFTLIGLYFIMGWTEVWDKAIQYDMFEHEIDLIKTCYPYKPLVICTNVVENNDSSTFIDTTTTSTVDPNDLTLTTAP